MFMFWGKRTSYTKRLLKAKVRGEHETECEAQENHHIVRNPNSPESSSSSSPSSSKHNKNLHQNNHKNSASTSCGINQNGCCYASASVSASNYYLSASSSPGSPKIIINDDIKSANDNYNNTDQQRTARCKELLKSLKENQLEMLLTAVESYGANLGGCVMVKRRRRGSDVNVDADYLKMQEDENCRRIIINGDETATSDTESLQMITTTTNTSQQQQQQQIDRNPNNYYSHHHRGHHHNNHNRRQLRQCNLKDNTNRDDLDDNDDNNKLNKESRRQIDYEENILLGDRITSTTTTTTTTTTTNLTTNLTQRRSRNSGSNNNNNNELPIDPHLLCCQIWRWPDLNNSSELKRLPVCHSAKDPVDICCNPYHWSRLCKPESPPPPYCLIADRLRPEDRAPSEGDVLHRYRNTNSPPLPGSLTTNGEDLSEQREWCTLAYWELGGRVGRLYPVEPSTVNVFDSLLDGDGLCLSNLAENHSTSPAIQRTRSKIGLGLTLSQESDGVWAYNRSENPIFVNSPTLDDPESRTLLVYRVPPGFCLNIFNREKTMKQSYSIQSSQISQGAQNFATGPVDVNSVRISFAKGWGPKYSRQEVTSCPCWLEVLLAPCR